MKAENKAAGGGEPCGEERDQIPWLEIPKISLYKQPRVGCGAEGLEQGWWDRELQAVPRVGRGKIIPSVADKTTLSHMRFSSPETRCCPSIMKSQSNAQQEGGRTGARGFGGSGCDPSHGCCLPHPWVKSELEPQLIWHLDASNTLLRLGERHLCWRHRPACMKRGPGWGWPGSHGGGAAAGARIWPSFRDSCLPPSASAGKLFFKSLKFLLAGFSLCLEALVSSTPMLDGATIPGALPCPLAPRDMEQWPIKEQPDDPLNGGAIPTEAWRSRLSPFKAILTHHAQRLG